MPGGHDSPSHFMCYRLDGGLPGWQTHMVGEKGKPHLPAKSQAIP